MCMFTVSTVWELLANSLTMLLQLLERKRNQTVEDMGNNIECLCQFLTTVGKKLDTDKAKVGRREESGYDSCIVYPLSLPAGMDGQVLCPDRVPIHQQGSASSHPLYALGRH